TLHRPLPLLGSNQDSPDPESGVLPVTPRGSFVFSHGAEGDRTPDLCSAIAALSQLSYSPRKEGKTTVRPPTQSTKMQAQNICRAVRLFSRRLTPRTVPGRYSNGSHLWRAILDR